MILYINSCVRTDSRTDRIAVELLKRLNDEFTELRLTDEALLPLNESRLNHRTELLEQGKMDDAMFRYARQFADADTIVIAAPYWDGSFPAILKQYIENIYVTGIVSKYDSNGMPRGLCSAKKLYYVTTAGGPYNPDFSYGYIRFLATQFFGIPETQLIYAEMLDVQGFDAEAIVQQSIESLESLL